MEKLGSSRVYLTPGLNRGLQVVLDMFSPGAVLDKLCGFIPRGPIYDALKADISHLAMEFCTRMGEAPPLGVNP